MLWKMHLILYTKLYTISWFNYKYSTKYKSKYKYKTNVIFGFICLLRSNSSEPYWAICELRSVIVHCTAGVPSSTKKADKKHCEQTVSKYKWDIYGANYFRICRWYMACYKHNNKNNLANTKNIPQLKRKCFKNLMFTYIFTYNFSFENLDYKTQVTATDRRLLHYSLISRNIVYN